MLLRLKAEDALPPEDFEGLPVRLVVRDNEVIFWTRMGERSFIRQSLSREQALELARFLMRTLSPIPGTSE